MKIKVTLDFTEVNSYTGDIEVDLSEKQVKKIQEEGGQARLEAFLEATDDGDGGWFTLLDTQNPDWEKTVSVEEREAAGIIIREIDGKEIEE